MDKNIKKLLEKESICYANEHNKEHYTEKDIMNAYIAGGTWMYNGFNW